MRRFLCGGFTSFSCRDGDAATRDFPRLLDLRWVFSSLHDFIVAFFEFVAAPTTETAVSTRDLANSWSHVAQAVPSNVEPETYCWCSRSSWIAVGVSREVEVDFFQLVFHLA